MPSFKTVCSELEAKIQSAWQKFVHQEEPRGTRRLKISESARKFMQEHQIEDVTFNLLEQDVTGCCLGMVKEIQPVYRAPRNAAGYRYFQAEGCHIFISRQIKLLGPLTLTTEGLFKKRLCLCGATVPL